jgi:hypothetical protein
MVVWDKQLGGLSLGFSISGFWIFRVWAVGFGVWGLGFGAHQTVSDRLIQPPPPLGSGIYTRRVRWPQRSEWDVILKRLRIWRPPRAARAPPAGSGFRV